MFLGGNRAGTGLVPRRQGVLPTLLFGESTRGRFGLNLFGVFYLLLRLPVGKGLVLHEDNVPTSENFLVDRVPHSVTELIIVIAEEYAWPGLWIQLPLRSLATCT